MRPTQRVYTDKETNERFRLFVDDSTKDFRLLSDGSATHAPGTEVNGFYLCPFDACTIKLNTKRTIPLSPGEFYNLKEGERVASRKFAGFNRFSKI